MGFPLVSFVLPAYKRTFFKQALASILGQSYKRIEVIVVDDASPEDLYADVLAFNDCRVNFSRNSVNIGGEDLVANWNLALQKATGDYCVLASDDDYYVPTFLERMVELAEQHPEADVFHCRVGMIDATGNLIKIAEKRPLFESCLDMIYARGVKRCLQVAPEFLFRREALVNMGGFVNFPLAWYSDDATWFLLSKRGGVYYTDEVLFFWRYSGKNISSKTTTIVCLGKVRAAERYKKWIISFLQSLSIAEDSEKWIRSYCLGSVLEQVNMQMLFDLSDTSFWGWVSILLSEKLHVRLKLRSFKNRLLQLCRF